MKLKFVLIGLLFLFSQSLFGQVPDLGTYGYRLVKTVKDADFDYQQLDALLKDKTALNSLNSATSSIFDPIDGWYTLYHFLVDMVSEYDKDNGLTYFPARLEDQRLLVLKVNDSRIIVDGYLFPVDLMGKPLSTVLFRMTTKNLQLRMELPVGALNFRNLFHADLRVGSGTIFVSKDLLWSYDRATKPEEVAYRLVKKADNADFNYDNLHDFSDRALRLLKQDKERLILFEPVDGEFTYYQFIADMVGQQLVFPESDYSDKLMEDMFEVFLNKDGYLDPLIAYQRVVILKTDAAGLIVDGYCYYLAREEQPLDGALFRMSNAGIRLRDGMNMQELGFVMKRELDNEIELSECEDVGKIFLIPKLD